MYTDINHFYCYNKKCVTHKSKITPPPHLYSVTPDLAKHTTANIDANIFECVTF